MSREIVDGVWVIKCDFKDEFETGCSFGVHGEPAMFIDPTGGRNPDEHFQCGRHHGIVKQEENPEFQLPEDHKLNNRETTLVKDENYRFTKKVELEGFKPDAGGRVWDGKNVKR